MPSDLDRIRQERDLYLRLLTLGSENHLDSFLKEALALVAELAGADKGYLELRGQHQLENETWRIASGFSDSELDDVRTEISTGIISAALSTGKTVVTPAAFLDPRFNMRGSVQLRKIGAVLCAPIGANDRLGVLYLHTVADGKAFSDEDRERVEIFAKYLAPLADRLLVRKELDSSTDATAPHRKSLRADALVGRSQALANVLKQVALVAPLDINVLLTGPTGSGKSLVAKVIHDSGPRCSGPFIELNCATLPPELLENELFGSARGGHSAAAKAPIPGKVQAAEGGTLFLDEVAELPLESQAKLLQLLQTKQYFPLGNNQPVVANIRLISATNASLTEAVRAKRFREDLLYRLQVLPIELPSLSNRVEDLAVLCEQLLERTCSKNGFGRLGFSRGARLAIRHAEWPGNIRQLDNLLQAAAIRAVGDGAAEITRAHVFPEIELEEPLMLNWNEATRKFQRQLLVDSLEECDWNVSEVARKLDLARSHIYNLINTLAVTPRQAKLFP